MTQTDEDVTMTEAHSNEQQHSQHSSSCTVKHPPPRASSSLESLPDQMQGASIATTSAGQQQQQQQTTFTLIAKFGKERIQLSGLAPEITIAQVKDELQERTRILPKRQKLVGLVAWTGRVHDDLQIQDLKPKSGSGKQPQQPPQQQSSSSSFSPNNIITHQFILMGTPEEAIFVDPNERDDLPDVIDDFDLDFNAGSDLWLEHVANGENLKKFTDQTEIHVMTQPRDGKPLLVLDLDHTLLDFSSKTLQRDESTQVLGQGLAAAMKRPHMDDFLTKCYQYYDLVVWSQTSWRWLETKLTELGMLTHPGYRFCFVLDKTSMFTVKSTKRDGTSVKHHVKPLQLIWSIFANRWNSTNTIHVDDLSRNFALNLQSGLKCSPYHRKKATGKRDNELLGIGRYLVQLAQAQVDFDLVDFNKWSDVVQGNCPLTLGLVPGGKKEGDSKQSSTSTPQPPPPP